MHHHRKQSPVVWWKCNSGIICFVLQCTTVFWQELLEAKQGRYLYLHMQYSAPKTSHYVPSLLITALHGKSCFVLSFLEREDNFKMFVKYSFYWLESTFKKKNCLNLYLILCTLQYMPSLLMQCRVTFLILKVLCQLLASVTLCRGLL